jgi:hypothetical protein
VIFRLVIGRFRLEFAVDLFVLLYLLGAGAAILPLVSHVRI